MLKRRIAHWVEDDVHSSWRKRYCYTQRPGVTAWVKRFTNRRERREGKAEAAQQKEEREQR